MDENTQELKMEEIVLNLKLVSKIKQNEKMIVINKILSVDHRIAQALFRWYTSDSRHDTITFIEMIINKGLDYTYSETIDQTYSKDIVKKELELSIAGLENLSATYKLDNIIVSKIDILKEKINRMEKIDTTFSK